MWVPIVMYRRAKRGGRQAPKPFFKTYPMRKQPTSALLIS